MSEVIQKIRKFLPAASFFGGFTWDSITLGKLVQTSDLAILLLYYALSFAALVVLAAFPEKFAPGARFEKWRDRLTYVVQFCFGSLFSALVVCYFKSSSSVGAFVLVALLAAFLVANEFLQSSYARFGFTLALFCLLGTMYLNFLVPHLVHGLGLGWFLLSVLLSLLVCYGAFRLSKSSGKTLVAPCLISAALVAAYVFNWIPPVPLVLKDQNACVGFSKDYSCKVDRPGLLVRLGIFSPTVTVAAGEGVTFMSSVFAPARIEAQLEHRWLLKNPKTGVYEIVDKISSSRMRTRGSREEGFRIYTQKKNVPPGDWMVETAVKGGSVIGVKKFRVEHATGEPPERAEWKIR